MKEQTCRICNETKDITEYHKNGSYLSGYLTICKKCVSERVKKSNKTLEKESNVLVKSEVERILTTIGYDLNKPIYPQFKDYVGRRWGKILKR